MPKYQTKSLQLSLKQIGNESVLVQLAQRWFPGLAISSDKLLIYFSNKVHGSNFIRHTHAFNGPFSGTTRVSRYQKGKTNLDFTEVRHSEWHQLGHVQFCTSLQTDNHASNPPLSFLQAGCPSCRPTNSVKALKG